MTIQQLRYFLALCEDLNYTHTAGRMYLSRQALRLSIAALEEELCGKLFVNNRNHLALTEKGERFRAQAAPVVQQFNALCQQAYQDIQSAPLRLGISVALVPDYLPNLGEVLEAFRQQYPGIPLELTSLSNDEVPVQLQRGALDAGLVMDLGGCAAGLARTAFHSIPPPSWSAAAALSGSERILHRQSWTGRPCWCPALPRMPWHRCGRHCGRAVHTHSWSWSSNFIRYSTARRSRIVYL